MNKSRKMMMVGRLLKGRPRKPELFEKKQMNEYLSVNYNNEKNNIY